MPSCRTTVPVGESQKGKETKLISGCFPLITSPESNNLQPVEKKNQSAAAYTTRVEVFLPIQMALSNGIPLYKGEENLNSYSGHLPHSHVTQCSLSSPPRPPSCFPSSLYVVINARAILGQWLVVTMEGNKSVRSSASHIKQAGYHRMTACTSTVFRTTFQHQTLQRSNKMSNSTILYLFTQRKALLISLGLTPM